MSCFPCPKAGPGGSKSVSCEKSPSAPARDRHAGPDDQKTGVVFQLSSAALAGRRAASGSSLSITLTSAARLRANAFSMESFQSLEGNLSSAIAVALMLSSAWHGFLSGKATPESLRFGNRETVSINFSPSPDGLCLGSGVENPNCPFDIPCHGPFEWFRARAFCAGARYRLR